VLELLETFVKRAEASPLLIELILPLLRTATDNTSGSNAQVRGHSGSGCRRFHGRRHS